jgi:hypothetical protein
VNIVHLEVRLPQTTGVCGGWGVGRHTGGGGTRNGQRAAHEWKWKRTCTELHSTDIRHQYGSRSPATHAHTRAHAHTHTHTHTHAHKHTHTHTSTPRVQRPVAPDNVREGALVRLTIVRSQPVAPAPCLLRAAVQPPLLVGCRARGLLQHVLRACGVSSHVSDW